MHVCFNTIMYYCMVYCFSAITKGLFNEKSTKCFCAPLWSFFFVLKLEDAVKHSCHATYVQKNVLVHKLNCWIMKAQFKVVIFSIFEDTHMPFGAGAWWVFQNLFWNTPSGSVRFSVLQMTFWWKELVFFFTDHFVCTVHVLSFRMSEL